MLSRRGDSTTMRRAVVIARWAGDTALLRTEDGRTVEASVPEALREDFDVGAEVRLDPAGDRIVGWGGSEAGQ